MKTYGQIAYEAYCEARSWKSFGGEPLPQWETVILEIQAAWEVAAREVVKVAAIRTAVG